MFKITIETNNLSNHLGRGWRKVGGGDHARHVNGILGLFIKEKFPGLVQFGGTVEPARGPTMPSPPTTLIEVASVSLIGHIMSRPSFG